MNRTIDDQYGDSVTGALPLFFPTTGVWNIGQTCTGCAIHAGNPIDPAHVFDGTWHDTSGGGPDRIVQVSFTGHAVYVYHIVLNILVAGASTVTTNLSFYIDSNYVGNYTHIPTSRSSASPVSYQMLVYSNNSMVQGEHTLEIVSLGSSKALVLFDYITYTTSEDNSQSSALPPSTALTASQTLARSTMETSSLPSMSATTSKPKNSTGARSTAGAIAGSAVAGLFIVLIAAYFLYINRSRRIRCHLARTASQLPPDGPDIAGNRGHTPVRGSALSTSRAPSEHHQSMATSSPEALPYSHVIRYTPESSALSEATMMHTERLELLTQQMRTLQAQLDDLRLARAERAECERRLSRTSAADEGLSTMIAALRVELSALRAEQHTVAYIAQGMPPPYRG